MSFQRLIIGCGTGRCGTTSLSKFLNIQDGVFVLHEGRLAERNHVVPWYEGEEQLWRWLQELKRLAGHHRWYGDVAPYYLPYVPKLVHRYPEIRIVCLERDKRAVVKSYLDKTIGRNHWYRHQGVGWTEDLEWDSAFPKYAARRKEEAVGLYWDHYHVKALENRALFPDNFLVIPTDALNRSAGRAKILAFVGLGGDRADEREFRANREHHRWKKRLIRRILKIRSTVRLPVESRNERDRRNVTVGSARRSDVNLP